MRFTPSALNRIGKVICIVVSRSRGRQQRHGYDDLCSPPHLICLLWRYGRDKRRCLTSRNTLYGREKAATIGRLRVLR